MQKFNQIGVFVVFVSSCSCSCLFRWKIPKTYCSSSYTGSICVCKIGKILCVRNSKIHTVCKTFFFQKINKFICFTCARNIIVSRNSESFVCARKLRTKWRQSVYSAFYRTSWFRVSSSCRRISILYGASPCANPCESLAVMQKNRLLTFSDKTIQDRSQHTTSNI